MGSLCSKDSDEEGSTMINIDRGNGNVTEKRSRRPTPAGAANLSRSTTFVYKMPTASDKIILFTSLRCKGLFTKEEMEKLKSKMPKNISKLFKKYEQFKLEKEKIDHESRLRDDLKLEKIAEVLIDGYYFGEFNSETEEREGRGVCIFKDDTMYEGFWKEDSMTGPGRLIKSSGEVYKGNFENGKFHGEGTLVQEVGDTRYAYEGNWKEGIMDGHGHEQFQDGSSYLGYYKNGKFSGKGILNQKDGSIYNGQFKDSIFNGKGIMKYSDGTKYKGTWSNGEKHGQGKTTYKNGGYYKGGYEYNLKHGYGEFKNADGSFYRGIFNKGKRDGEGEEYSPKKGKNSAWSVFFKDGKKITKSTSTPLPLVS